MKHLQLRNLVFTPPLEWRKATFHGLDMSLVSLKNSSPLRSKGQSMLLHYKAVEFAERREGFIVPHCDQESARSSNVSGVWERGEETADSPRTFSLVSLGS